MGAGHQLTSLQDLIDSVPNLAEHFYNNTLAPHYQARTSLSVSQFRSGTPYKATDRPVSYYGFPKFDEVRNARGRLVGLSTLCGYSANEAAMLSLAMIDSEHAKPGTEVALLWGEPGGGSKKPHVERHKQREIRATVALAAYSESVRRLKRAASFVVGVYRSSTGREHSF